MPNMKEIRDIAAAGNPLDRMEKAELIRAIQRAEGNFDCFGTRRGGVQPGRVPLAGGVLPESVAEEIR